VCPDPALPFPFSKRRQGSVGLAPRKALKTVPASAASAVACHTGWLAPAQDALKRGAEAARVALEQVSQADPSIGEAIAPGEAAGVAAALSPPVVLPTLSPASAEAVAILPVEPPVAADAGMAEVPPLEVVSDLPSLSHKERATAVAEVGDRKPASLAEGKPVRRQRWYPMRRLQGVPTPWRRGAQNRDLSWGAVTLSPRGVTPMSDVGRRSGSGPAAPRNPSSSLMTSGRSSLGMSSVSMPRRRWGRFGRPWRSSPRTFPGSSR
jgi:hypothetical protein